MLRRLLAFLSLGRESVRATMLAHLSLNITSALGGRLSFVRVTGLFGF